MLPSELKLSDLNHDYFLPPSIPLSIDLTWPYLSSAIVWKLTKYVGHVAHPTKWLCQVAGGVLGTLQGKGHMADIDTQVLSQLLKILELTIKGGEDIDLFASHHVPTLLARSLLKKPSMKKKTKAKKTEWNSQSLTPKNDEGRSEDVTTEDEVPAGDVEADFEKLVKELDITNKNILAADRCIALLGSDRLVMQVYCGAYIFCSIF